jgi:hypothetical protein
LAVGLLSIYVARRHGMRAAGTIGSFLAHRGLIAGRGQPCCDRSRPLSRDGWCRRHWCLGAYVQRVADGSMVAWIPLTFALSLVVGSIETFVSYRARSSSCQSYAILRTAPRRRLIVDGAYRLKRTDLRFLRKISNSPKDKVRNPLTWRRSVTITHRAVLSPHASLQCRIPR